MIVRVCVVVIKHQDQSNLERKGFISSYILQSFLGGSHGRNSVQEPEAGSEAEDMKESLSLACSDCFLITPGIPSQVRHLP